MTEFENRWAAKSILERAREKLRRADASGNEVKVRYAEIRLDMLTIGSKAVQRKIAAGHEYGTAGTTRDIPK